MAVRDAGPPPPAGLRESGESGRVSATVPAPARGFLWLLAGPARAVHTRCGDDMTILDDVARLVIRLSPEPVCDDCIADKLDLSVRQHANHKTRELAGSNGFTRSKGACSLCGATKLVIAKG